MANDNLEVFDVEIAYNTSGDKAALDAAKEIDNYLSRFTEGVTLDIGADTTGIDGALESLNAIEGLEDIDIPVNVDIEDADIEGVLSNLEAPDLLAGLDVDTSAAETNIDAFEGNISDLNISATLDDETVVSDLQELDETQVAPEADLKETKQSKEVKDGIVKLATMKSIEVALNVVGTALDFLKKIDDFTLQPILDAEDAAARFAGQTGQDVTGIADIIRGVLYDDLGDSAGQIANLFILAQSLNAPFEEATRSALLFTHTFSDENPEEVLKTLVKLTDEGLVGSFGEATDLLTAFYQQGGNVGGDALKTIQDYAVSWKDMGLTATQALGLIESGLDGGITGATDAARAIQTFDDNLTAAAENPTSDQAQILRRLGLENPKEQGAEVGADFIDGFIEKIKDLPASDQEEAINAFFGKGGKKFTGAIPKLDTGALGPYADLIGAAEEAATQVDDSLRGILDDFVLAANEKVSEILTSDAIDLDGKIEALKTGLQNALDTLTSGGTLSEAIEVGLKPIGFDDEWENLERILGNFSVSLLGIVAGIQEAMGQGSAASLTRAEVARLSQQQLASDLQIANPQESEALIRTAQERGVGGEGITEALKTAVQEMIASGDLAGAKELAASLEAIPGAVIEKRGLGGILTERVEVPIEPTLDPAKYQAMVDEIASSEDVGFGESVTTQVFGIDASQVTQLVDDAVTTAETAWQNAINSRDFGLAQKIAEDLGDESLLASTFQQASLGGDLGVAESVVQDLKDNKEFLRQAFDDAMFHGYAGVAESAAGLLEDPALIAQATALATDLRTEIDNALQVGDTDEASILAQKLGDEEVLEKIGAIKDGAVTSLAALTTAAQQAATDSGTAMDTVGEKAGQMDDDVTEAITGNSVVTEFQAMRNSAETELPAVAAALQTIDAISFSTLEGNIESLIALLENLKTAATNATLAAALNAAQNYTQAGGGTVNQTNTSVSLTQNIQSPAQAGAASNFVDELLGLPK